MPHINFYTILSITLIGGFIWALIAADRKATKRDKIAHESVINDFAEFLDRVNPSDFVNNS